MRLRCRCTQAGRFVYREIAIFNICLGRGLVRHTAWLLGRGPVQIPAFWDYPQKLGDDGDVGLTSVSPILEIEHCHAVSARQSDRST